MDKRLTINRASHEDVPEIMEIMEAACRLLKDKAWFFMDDEETIRRHIEEKGFTLKAEADGRIAGFLSVRFPGTDGDNLGPHLGLSQEERMAVAHMEAAAVRPDCRGRGIQKSLMCKAEELLRDMPYRYLMGTAHPDNTYSVNNFLRLEYDIVDEGLKYGGLPRYVFCKRVWP